MLTHLSWLEDRRILALNPINERRLQFDQACLICKLTNKEKKNLCCSRCVFHSVLHWRIGVPNWILVGLLTQTWGFTQELTKPELFSYLLVGVLAEKRVCGMAFLHVLIVSYCWSIWTGNFWGFHSSHWKAPTDLQSKRTEVVFNYRWVLSKLTS